VIDLSDDELLDQVRFQLPSHLGARYGTAPTEAISSASSVHNSRLIILADIEMTSPISKVSSPSHTVEFSLGPRLALPQGDSRPFSHFASLKLTMQAFLDKDFVLSVQSAKLDFPRCIAETLLERKTTALSLTLVPRFDIPPIATQEYVFVIDRSGSMEDRQKIRDAKRALVVLLKSLPNSGTSFNIVSFGSSHSSLWPESRLYSEETLKVAVSNDSAKIPVNKLTLYSPQIKHVDRMHADLGGTEIESALHSVFNSRNSTIPTSIFLLTDGEVSGHSLNRCAEWHSYFAPLS
jgi:hypothetical protein